MKARVAVLGLVITGCASAELPRGEGTRSREEPLPVIDDLKSGSAPSASSAAPMDPGAHHHHGAK